MKAAKIMCIRYLGSEDWKLACIEFITLLCPIRKHIYINIKLNE